MNKERLEQLREQAQSTADEVTRALHENPNIGQAVAVTIESYKSDERLGRLLADTAHDDGEFRKAIDANSAYALDFLDQLHFECHSFATVMRKYRDTIKEYDKNGKPF